MFVSCRGRKSSRRVRVGVGKVRVVLKDCLSTSFSLDVSLQVVTKFTETY